MIHNNFFAIRLLRYNVTKEGVNLVLEYLDYSLDRMNLAGPVDPDLTKVSE